MGDPSSRRIAIAPHLWAGFFPSVSPIFSSSKRAIIQANKQNQTSRRQSTQALPSPQQKILTGLSSFQAHLESWKPRSHWATASFAGNFSHTHPQFTGTLLLDFNMDGPLSSTNCKLTVNPFYNMLKCTPKWATPTLRIPGSGNQGGPFHLDLRVMKFKMSQLLWNRQPFLVISNAGECMVTRAISQGPRGSVNWHNLVIKIFVDWNVEDFIMDNVGGKKTGRQDQQMGKKNSILLNTWTHYSSQERTVSVYENSWTSTWGERGLLRMKISRRQEENR